MSYRPTEKEIHQYVRIFVKTAKRELSKPWKEKEMSCKHTIGTAVDEDGCCVSCGADLNPIAMAETPSPIHKWLKEDAVRYDLTTEEIIQQLCEENEAYQAELAEARKKPEPTDEGCTNCKNRLEAEIDRLTAENKLLKWLLGKRRKAEGHWCDVSRLNADLKAKDAEITGLRDYVKSYAACTWDGIGACPECGLERGVFKPQAAIEHGNIITELKAELKAKDAALEKLARLGNEPYLGNSEGNIIAQQALKEKP